jgi:DNA-directed RNA polymerase
MLLSQQEVELRMYHSGIKRAEDMMTRAEEAGRAATNPYAKSVFATYVLQLSEAIKTDLQEKRPQWRGAEIQLLSPLDPDVVAFLAVRTVLNSCLTGSTMNNRTLGYSLGRTIHRELVLAQIENECPELFYTLEKDFARRMSKDERHRLTVFKMQAAKHGIEVVEWPKGSRDVVGLYLVQKLVDAGMLYIDLPYQGKYREVGLTDEAMSSIKAIREYTAQSMPWYGPCVELPRDWTSVQDGGWHTPQLRARNRMLVKCSASARPEVRDADMPEFLAAVNALQRTAWKVNERMYDVIVASSRAGLSNKELVTNVEAPRPDRPAWLDTDQASWTPEQQGIFRQWKHSMSEWYTERKLQTTRFMRFHSAITSAATFKDYPNLHFVYFADSRGRLYPLTYGFNPQGSDMQKALLHFAKGKPLLTESAVKWFLVQGANKWGYDKATLAERCQWVRDRDTQIMAMAAAPLDNREWMQAGDPFQFLAWCFEYADWRRLGDAFESHLPISMDGSCNGLQNFSAMLRDEVGGKATNLTANTTMEDIYRTVADAAYTRMSQTVYEDAAKESLRQRWIKHGIERSVVKRSVMTTPYGVTRRSAEDYVVWDYLREGSAPLFDKAEYRAAATVLMDSVWPAIGDVVIKAREAMAWLRKSARAIIEVPLGEPIITWVTPSGFVASQSYFDLDTHVIRTRLAGTAQIRVATESDDPDESRHIAGLAPNFVHSMDAAHLHLVSAAAGEYGIGSLAMIHDDYGTHAADAEKLFHLIRLKFYQMYTEHDPLFDLSIKYPECGAPPKKGTLDLSEVLRSEFFFS